MTTPFRTTSMLVLALAASACGSATAPDGALIGVWGGEGVKLLAGPKGVRVTNGCSGFESSQALVPDPDGRFLISNVESIGDWSTGDVMLRGTVSGRQITFDVVAVTAGNTVVTSYTVTKGRKAELSLYCLLTASP